MKGRTRAWTQVAGPAAVALLVTGLVLLLGRSPVRAQAPVSPGERLYQQDCAWCHGARGEGSARGPSLQDVGAASADFMLRTGRMPIPTVERQPPRKTPAYTPEQISSLVDVVASFGSGPPIPTVDPAAGDLGRGADLYEIHCAACHSSTGVGGALTNGLFAPGLEKASPTEVAEAVRLGGAGLRSGNMPKFGPEVLDQHQLDSVVRYVDYLRHPQDRGGAPLGHLGPIAEGLAAWAGALLLLLVFVRWIGERSK